MDSIEEGRFPWFSQVVSVLVEPEAETVKCLNVAVELEIFDRSPVEVDFVIVPIIDLLHPTLPPVVYVEFFLHYIAKTFFL